VGLDVDLAHDSHSLAYFLSGASQQDDDIYVMINAYWEDLFFTVQESPVSGWRRVVYTSFPRPDGFHEYGQEQKFQSLTCKVRSRSIVVLMKQRQ
jgi:glycogen operon protein